MIQSRHTVHLAFSLALLGAFAPAVAQAQANFAAPTFHEVHLLVGGGQHAGTESTLWVRIYSEDDERWSGWKTISGGLAAGSATSLLFEASPDFTGVSRVQVWEGSGDGVRASVRVRSSNGITQRGVKSRVWIKNGSSTFDLAELAAFECDPDLICSCDVGADCISLWFTGICHQDSWECFDYSSDVGGDQFCVCSSEL